MKKFLCYFLTLWMMISYVYAQKSHVAPNGRSGCQAPTNVVVDHIAGASALVSWTPSAQAQSDAYYFVECAEHGTNNWMQESTTQNRLMLSGLQPQTMYDVRLYVECENGYSDTVVSTFSTGCLAGGEFTVGNGTLFDNDLPTNGFYRYSITQQIYTAAEMRGATTLSFIAFDCAFAYSGTRNLSVYLMHTSQSTPTTWLPMQNAQLVYSGPTTFGQGWNSFIFSTPFVYNGTDNLAVIVIDETGSYVSYDYFYAHQTSTTTLCFSSDNLQPSISNLPSAANSSTSRLNTKFGAACNNTITCVAPNVLVSDVAGDAVTIEWAPGANEYMWNIDYKLASASTWTSLGSVASSPYTINNLAPMSSYQIRITSDCGNNEYSEPVVLDVTTACSGITTLPFTENFDQLSGNDQIPMCWNSGTNQMFETPSLNMLAHSAPNSMNFDGNASHYAYLALPRLDDQFDISNLVVSFYAMRLSNTTPSFELGVMNDPTDYSTFAPITQAYPSEVGPWELMEVNTSNYTGTGRYLAFRSNCYMFLDDITITEAPSCFHVSNVTIDSVTSASADLHWTAGAFETAWDVVYGLHGTVDPDVAPYETVNGTPNTSIYSLLANSYYDIYVRANCGGSQSDWVSTSFWTGCEAIDVIPYNVDFEMVDGAVSVYAAANNLPHCWSYLNTGANNDYLPLVVDAPDFAASGSNTVYFATADMTGYGEQYAILPEIDVMANPLNMLSLSLDARTTANDTLVLEVGVMSDPTMANTFVAIDTITTTSAAYQTYTVDFSSYFGTETYIAIRAGHSVFYNTGYVDNISLDYMTSCERPTALQVNSTAIGEVTLQWTLSDPTQTEWEVEYGPRGFEVGTGLGTVLAVSTTPVATISGLSDGIYDFYVRSLCGTYDWSPWRGPVAGCPDAYVMHQNAVDTLYTCSMRIFDNGGVANSYATNSNDVLVIYPDQTGMFANITGTFRLESWGDVLSIYDGVGMTGGLLWESSDVPSGVGTMNVTSTTGPLTLHFTSNSSNSYDGFELMAQCVQAASCVHPDNLTTNNITSNALTLGWTAYGQETQWVIEYGESGFVPGNGTQVTVSTNPYTIQNLSSNTAYDFYVRALCSSSDTSDYSLPVSAATTQILTQTPYFTDFSNAQENAMWTLVNGNQTNKWYIGQPTGCTDNVLFVSNNGTAAAYTFDESSVVWAYRDIQFGQNASEFELSFNWKAEGETVYPIAYDFLRVYLADPIAVEAGVWDESSLTPLSDKLNRQSSWQHFTTVIDGSYSGQTKRLIFVWKNDNRDGNNPSAMIDSVQIRELTCGSPRNLTVLGVTDQTATISFTAPANSSQWQYVYSTMPFNPDDYTPFTINDTMFTVTNLMPETEYYLYVRTACSASDYSLWTGPLTFQTDTMVPVVVCDMPTNVAVSEITHYSALVSWNPGGQEDNWNVQYKQNAASSWDNIQTNTPYVTLSNLTENTPYQVRVQALCSDDLTSDWTDAVSFTTLIDGIDEYTLDASVRISPNPTTGECTILNSQCAINVVNVYDVYGKLLNTISVNDATVQIDLGQYAAGVYFIRVTTDNGAVTKRVVKK